jgi:hypothetical protein
MTRFKGKPQFGLTEPCRLRGYKIQPRERLYVGWSLMRCPKCGQHFDPLEGKKPPQSTS